MNRIAHNLILDMKSVVSQHSLDIQRYDTGRKLVITLSDNGAVYPINDGCFAVFMATKPDGTILYNHCDIVDNTIVFDLLKNPQVAAAEGEVRCEIRLYGADGSLITSPCFDIVVDKVVYTDNIIESSSEFSELTKAIVANINAVEAANQAVRNAEASVGNFTGQALGQIEQFESDAEQEVDDAVSNAETKVNKSVAEAKNEINAAVSSMMRIVDDSANALKGKVSGTAVTMPDVSSIEHEVKVRVHGKNLFAPVVDNVQHQVSTEIDGNYVIKTSGAVEGKTNGYSQLKLSLKAGVYTLSANFESYTASTIYKAIRVWEKANAMGVTYGAWQESNTKLTFTVPKDGDVWFGLYGCCDIGEYVLWTIQLEAGETATEYESWLDPSTVTLFASGESGEEVSYTPKSDGTVDGVKSIYPVMNLRTDTEGAIIEAEYNRDLNKAFQALLDRVVALEAATAVE